MLQGKQKRYSMHYIIFSFPFLDLLSRIDLDELMKKDEPPLEFPDTLEGFEYLFNESKSYVLCKDYTYNNVEGLSEIELYLISPY